MRTDDIKPTRVVTGEVKLTFVHVFDPFLTAQAHIPHYSLTALIPKEDKEMVERLWTAHEAAVMLGVKSRWGGRLPDGVIDAIRDGDVEGKGPEFKGCIFIRCATRNRPAIVSTKIDPSTGRLVRLTDSTELYSGCFGRVSLSFFPYSNPQGKGVLAGLNHVQKTRDGQMIVFRRGPEDDFLA